MANNNLDSKIIKEITNSAAYIAELFWENPNYIDEQKEVISEDIQNFLCNKMYLKKYKIGNNKSSDKVLLKNIDHFSNIFGYRDDLDYSDNVDGYDVLSIILYEINTIYKKYFNMNYL